MKSIENLFLNIYKGIVHKELKKNKNTNNQNNCLNRYLKILSLIITCILFNVYIYSQESMDTFNLSGIKWKKRISEHNSGPGNNTFGLHERNVYLDKDGNINLKIKKTGRTYSCAEIYSDSFFGKGRYEITIATNTKQFSPQMVLGIFLYDQTASPHFNEIDIEYAQWGNKDIENAQYAIHTNNNIEVSRFYIPKKKLLSKHTIDISNQDIIITTSIYNKRNNEFDLFEEKKFVNPQEFDYRNTRFHFNLWLTDTPEKKVGKNPKVKIKSFKYTPNIK